jgi:hypothetical protein
MKDPNWQMLSKRKNIIKDSTSSEREKQAMFSTYCLRVKLLQLSNQSKVSPPSRSSVILQETILVR